MHLCICMCRNDDVFLGAGIIETDFMFYISYVVYVIKNHIFLVIFVFYVQNPSYSVNKFTYGCENVREN